MTINGVELDFDLYDSKNQKLKKRYLAELGKMREISSDLRKEASEKEQIEYLCGRIKRIFDKVFGNGIGEKVCGSGSNLKICMHAYEQLVSEQIRQNKEYKTMMGRIRNLTDKAKEMTQEDGGTETQ